MHIICKEKQGKSSRTLKEVLFQSRFILSSSSSSGTMGSTPVGVRRHLHQFFSIAVCLSSRSDVPPHSMMSSSHSLCSGRWRPSRHVTGIGNHGLNARRCPLPSSPSSSIAACPSPCVSAPGVMFLPIAGIGFQSCFFFTVSASPLIWQTLLLSGQFLGLERELHPVRCRPRSPTISGFLLGLSTSRDALGGSSVETFTTDGIAPAGYPLLGRCHPLTTLRCGSDFRLVNYLNVLNAALHVGK